MGTEMNAKMKRPRRDNKTFSFLYWLLFLLLPFLLGPAKAEWSEIQQEGNLLLANGELATTGYAHGFLLRYNRKALSKASRDRLKEWEHYTIISSTATVAITVADLGFASYAMVEVVDLRTKKLMTNLFFNVSVPLTSHLPRFPLDPYGPTEFRQGRNFVSFTYDKGVRRADFFLAKSLLGPQMKGSFVIKQGDIKGLSAVSPYRQRHLFFYEYKIPGMKTEGRVTVGQRSYQLQESDSHAIFDWGRGAWPRHGKWHWGEAAGRHEGQALSMNLGHGYEDGSDVSLNAIFWKNQLHKVGAVEWTKLDSGPEWRLRSEDGKVDLLFRPDFIQNNKMNLLLYRFHLHKMFGTFSGQLRLDEGSVLTIEGLRGHLERMRMKW